MYMKPVEYVTKALVGEQTKIVWFGEEEECYEALPAIKARLSKRQHVEKLWVEKLPREAN